MCRRGITTASLTLATTFSQRWSTSAANLGLERCGFARRVARVNKLRKIWEKLLH